MSNLKIGIVGLANVGKSTLFNALTNAGALAANYPFATIEPNTGIVPVPDSRLEVLGKIYQTEKIVPATVEFVDIAGLIAGASQGEGLGNKFLANIRECHAILHVVRAFQGDDIVRVGQSAKYDIDIVNTELELADLQTREKTNKKGIKTDEHIPYLTEKPVIYMFNMDEQNLSNKSERQSLSALVPNNQCVFVNAKLEAEMSGMSPEDKAEFLKSYGVAEDGLAQLVHAAYSTLGLQSFLTAGKKEVRAWTVRKGATAPQAAGVIHTDFERGFISAAICNYDDLVRLGSEKAVKEAGLMRTEGKDYKMQEGDVVEFRFNV
jgi:ribosome-binding ATPase YchF (GTP1/OBG family)